MPQRPDFLYPGGSPLTASPRQGTLAANASRLTAVQAVARRLRHAPGG